MKRWVREVLDITEGELADTRAAPGRGTVAADCHPGLFARMARLRVVRGVTLGN